VGVWPDARCASSAVAGRLVSLDHVDGDVMNDSFCVCRVRFPDGFKDIVSLLPHDLIFASGLAAQAIVGRCVRLLEEGESITEANFRPNRLFIDLLHDVIAREAPTLPALQEQARQQGSGWIYVVDARTPSPEGEVPPHDIIGAFEVREGVVVQMSYQPNANHRLCSSDGFFRLEPALHQRLIERLVKQATNSQH
jgi:hypothetical protein